MHIHHSHPSLMLAVAGQRCPGSLLHRQTGHHATICPVDANAHGSAGQKGIARKTLGLVLQLRCHNSFQPLKHQLYHIKPPLTINIRLWKVFGLGVYYGALESLLTHVLQEKLIVRDASAATSLAFIEITAWRTIPESPPPPPPPPPQISFCRRRRRRCCRHYSSHTQPVLCRSEK
jgi:hypothetical protein